MTAYAGNTRFRAIAIEAIAARRIVGNVITRIGRFVAAIGCTLDVVIAIDWSAHDAPLHGIACFYAVAEKPIRAKVVVFDMLAGVEGLVTEIIGARHAVVAIERRAIDTPEHRITRFYPVARNAIAAKSIIYRIRTRIHGFVARIHRARNSVVARRSGTRCATRSHRTNGRIARLRAIAIQTIATGRIVGRIQTHAHCANVDCAGKTVVAFGIVYANRSAPTFAARAGRCRHSARATHTARSGNISAHPAGTHSASTTNAPGTYSAGTTNAPGTYSSSAPNAPGTSSATDTASSTGCSAGASNAAGAAFAACTGRTRAPCAARTRRHIRGVTPIPRGRCRIDCIAAAADDR